MERRQIKQIVSYRLSDVNKYKDGKEDVELNSRLLKTTKLFWVLYSTFTRN